jgi:hypothetical protein
MTKPSKPSQGGQPEAGRARDGRSGGADALRPGPFRTSDLALQPDVADRERKLAAQESRREEENGATRAERKPLRGRGQVTPTR